MSNTEPDVPAAQRLEVALERIATPQGELAFTDVFADSARKEAEAADRRAATGSRKGPLDGRIVSVKALFDVAGTVTTAGSAILRAQPPVQADAPVVRRLRDAGAVIIGKTQMTEFAFSALGTNPHDGVPGNPHDCARAPGGSSSGGVVSVIDGMAEIAIGSDTGGSIRIPSALSGAVGFKPTGGRVPTRGAFSLSSTLDTIGPIASSVRDCAVTDAIIAGQEGDAPTAAETGSFRLVIGRGRLFDRTEPEIQAAFADAVARLGRAGETVEEGTLEPVMDLLSAIDKIGTFPSIEVGATLKGLGYDSLDGVDPKTRTRIEAGANILAADYVRMARLRALAVEAFQGAMSDDDVYVLPTTPIRAPLLADIADAAAFHEANGLVLRNPRVANMLDCPSVSLPLPVAGMPVGLMLIGHRGADRRLLEIAARLETVLMHQ